LFTVAILGTGLLGVPVLAGSAAYALSEAFHWEEGLSKKFSQAKGFYITIIVATIVGVFINFSSISPITMLYYAAALNGVLAPPLMIMILLISNNKKILGEYTNSKTSNILGVIITVLMSIMAIIFLGTMF
jgi:Mn2+/Fe2+ NRAMP family transporter